MALHELYASCEFGGMEEEILHDQLVERASNTRIHDETLLLEPQLTLTKAVNMARQRESALLNATLLSDPASVQAINSTHRKELHSATSPLTCAANSSSTKTHRS